MMLFWEGFSGGEGCPTVSGRRSNWSTQMSILRSHPDCGEPRLRMGGGGWRLRDGFHSISQQKELFVRMDNLFRQEHFFWKLSLYENFPSSGKNSFELGGSFLSRTFPRVEIWGRNSFPADKFFPSVGSFLRATRWVENQRGLPRSNETYVNLFGLHQNKRNTK